MNEASRKHANDDGARAIREFCKRFTVTDEEGNVQVGLEYETISQLGDSSSAVSGLFWKPNENWIVVAFKGTSPLGA